MQVLEGAALTAKRAQHQICKALWCRLVLGRLHVHAAGGTGCPRLLEGLCEVRLNPNTLQLAMVHMGACHC